MFGGHRRFLQGFLFLFMLMLVSAVNAADERVLPSKEEIASRMELVREIKEFEARLGWKPTKNFERYEGSLPTYDYCVRSGKFGFTLSWKESTKEECAAAEREYDAEFYQFEALARIETPLSRSMVSADLARFIMVVFHEEYHEQVTGISSRSLDESAAMLMGLLVAREFAREKYGENSEVYRVLASDMKATFLDAQIEKRYHDKLTRLYEEVAQGRVGHGEGLKKKSELYRAMLDECKSVSLATAISCTSITNNAIFGNSFDYAKHYPLFYDLHEHCGGDVGRTDSIIVGLASEGLTEEDFVHRVNDMIKKGCKS